MTPYDGSLLWCAAQTLVIAALGLLAVQLLWQRAPAAGATAAVAAATTIVVVTLLVPMRLPAVPDLWISSSDEVRVGEQSAAVAQTEALAAAGAESDQTLKDEAQALFKRLIGFAQSHSSPEHARGISTRDMLIAMLLASTGVGLLQFVFALVTVEILRRSRRPVEDESLQRRFATLQATLGIKRPVELCESDKIASPALIGWRRPMVLLPAGWTDWTPDQLDAALAHELAHAARGDFLWRAVARFAVAIHFCQPLVHWLARRLALMQELATDRLAAEAVGGTATYVRSLSELAIRLDDRKLLRAEPLVLPALSSHFTRRIAMLRSKDGSHVEGRRKVGGLLAATCIALVGATTFALRSAAQSDDVTPVVPAAKAFDAAPLDLSFMGPIEAGRIVVRPQRMTQRRALAPLVEFIQSAMDASTANEAHATEWRSRLDMFEYYAIQVHFAAARENDHEIEQFDPTAMTCDLAIRFTDEPAANDYWALLKAYPHAEVVDVDGVSYVRVSAKPMGDQVPTDPIGTMYVGKRDDRTFVLSDNMERLKRMVEYTGVQPEDDKRLLWESLDGGLATAFGDRQFTEFGLHFLESGPSNQPIDFDQVLMSLRNDITTFGFGIDLDPDTNDIKLRIKALCNSVAEAERVNGGFATLQSLAKAQLAMYSQSVNDPQQGDQLTNGDRAAIDAHLCWTRLLAEAKFQSRPTKGKAIEVHIEATAPFPQQLTIALFRPTYATPEEGAK